MPATFDLGSIEPCQRQSALRELLLQKPVLNDVSTGSLDQLRVVSCVRRGAFVHRGERRVSRTR